MQADLQPLVAAGVKGFKCFLIDSGIEVRPSYPASFDRMTWSLTGLVKFLFWGRNSHV